jgi:hypothetical protein
MGDLGIFPPASTGRYTAREGAEPWTRVDKMLLFPVLAACGSEYSYLETSVALCRFLDRSPVFPPTQRPGRGEVQAAAVKILERKTVTEVLTRGVLEDLAHRVFTGRRTGRPWTWTEIRLVRSYHNKRVLGGCRTALEQGEFLCLLNRGWSDGDRLQRMLDTLASHQMLDNPPEDRAAHPGGLKNLPAALIRVRSIGEEIGSEFPAAWSNLYDVLEGLPSSTLR